MWSLIIEPGKKYSQTVDSSFHISNAVLDLRSATDEDITLLLNYNGQDYIICYLNKSNKQQKRLNLTFAAGEIISLFSHGQASVHLSGYLLNESFHDDNLLKLFHDHMKRNFTLGTAQEKKTNGFHKE